MIETSKHINELYNLKHINDKELYSKSNYENEILRRSLSNVLYRNDLNANFLNLLQQKMVWMIDSTLIIRNYWNYTVDKFYNRHSN
jgi:hypothetical protein